VPIRVLHPAEEEGLAYGASLNAFGWGGGTGGQKWFYRDIRPSGKMDQLIVRRFSKQPQWSRSRFPDYGVRSESRHGGGRRVWVVGKGDRFQAERAGGHAEPQCGFNINHVQGRFFGEILWGRGRRRSLQKPITRGSSPVSLITPILQPLFLSHHGTGRMAQGEVPKREGMPVFVSISPAVRKDFCMLALSE